MRGLRSTVVAVVVVVLGALAFARLTSTNGPVASNPAFGRGLSKLAVSTATKVRLSPDNTRVALVENGSVTVVRTKDGSRVMSAGNNVVDAAWMPDGTRVIVVEGPIPTGEIAAVDMDGRAVGIAALKPSIEFGDGFGLAVNSDGTHVTAIAVTRDAIGGAVHTDVADINLQTGVTRVFRTPAEERTSIWVTDDAIGSVANGVFSIRNLVDNGVTEVVNGVAGGPFVTTATGEVVLETADHELLIVDPASPDKPTLRALPAGHEAVDVDTQVTRALVRVTERDGTVHLSMHALT